LFTFPWATVVQSRALFVVDVHSTASFLVKIADKPAAERALRTVLNRVNVTSRAYQIRVGCDNDSALVAALIRAAKPFPNDHVTTYPSGEPNCNPSERMWRHIQQRAKVELWVKSKSQDFWEPRI
jgi:hypothetical protein